MNIRVDLNIPINDGTEVVFRSPVDCSQVTGLKVYYPGNGFTASQEFVLADAHGNNVGNIDHLFGENVVVKVILDVTTGMAFVQNADTNAYLERRFEELGKGGGGGGVAPLIVTFDDRDDRRVTHTAAQIHEHAVSGGDVWLDTGSGFLALTRHTEEVVQFSAIGANYSIMAYRVYDDATYEYVEDTLASADEVAVIDDTTVGSDAWSSKKTVDTLCPDFTESGAVVRCEPVEGYPLTVVASEEATKITRCGKNIFDKDSYHFTDNRWINKNTGGSVGGNTGLCCTNDDYIPVSYLRGKTITLNHIPTSIDTAGMAFYDADKVYISGGKGLAMLVPETAVYMKFTVDSIYADGKNVQIEIGDRATSYEPYVSDIFTPGEQIPALKGVNILYADNGEITVSSKVSPTEILGTVENITKTYELIEDFTLAENATSITRNTDPNGNPYNFSAVRMFVETAPIEDVTNGQVIFSIKDADKNIIIYHQVNSGITNAARRTSLVARNDNGLIEYYALNASGESPGTLSSKPAYNAINAWRNICSIGLSTHQAPYYPAGTRIVIYAIRR